MSLEVNGIVKHFWDSRRGTFKAVDNVSFNCAPGEIFGLLGPNGAGKTTILRMISSLLSPDSGTICVQGFDTIKQPENVRKNIGFLSSDTGVYEKMTAREMLTFFAKVSKCSGNIKERVDAVIKTLQLDSFADVRCDKLSAGMRQRVSIARAVVHDPPIIALDEPTNSLDVTAIRAMHNFIRQCRESGKCVVLSTHLMHEAEKLCDRMAILHKGTIFAMGSLPELQELSGERYLEEIFMALVPETTNECV
ncbi:MAG TPA: heme ABC exporter ATP-binding protein CcmA [Planktothrix sp.]|jgi:sodium transport system ATP-binding protein